MAGKFKQKIWKKRNIKIQKREKKMMECNFFHYLFIYFTPPRKKPTLSRKKNPHGFSL
jgi:hypothetical protein